jgi:HlyD family secretion protein
VQNLAPGPPRRGFSQSPARREPDAPADGHSRVWVLRDGKAAPLPVKTGVSDGMQTEISGEGVTENLEVIISARYPAPS